MKLCNTTENYLYFCKDEFEKLTELKRAGFKYADFSMYGDEARAFLHDNWRDDIKRLKEHAEKLGVKYVQAHSPAFETLETLDPNENWDEKLKETIRSIEICGELDIPMTVIHAGVKRHTSKEDHLRLNKEFYELLIPVMEKTGVNVLVENVGAEDNNGRYYFNNATRLREFIEYFNHPLLHACWDIGHANSMNLNQAEEMAILGEHLYAIHFNDNNAIDDQHRIPFLGTTNQDNAIRGLINVNFKGPFTFECGGTFRELKKFDKASDKQNLAIDVLRASEKLLFEMGKYLLSSYGVYEE